MTGREPTDNVERTDFDTCCYSRVLAKRPLICVLVITLVLLNFSVLILPLGKHLYIDLDFSGFWNKDHFTHRREAGRIGSQTNRVVDDRAARRVAEPLGVRGQAAYTIPRTYPEWHITLIYQSEGNILSQTTLAGIREFEGRIFESAAYQTAGWRDTHSPNLATSSNTEGTHKERKERIARYPPVPISSFVQYLYPTVYNRSAALDLAARLRCCSHNIADCPWGWASSNVGCPPCEGCSRCTRCALRPVPGSSGGLVYDGRGNSPGNLTKALRHIVRSNEVHDLGWFFGSDFHARKLTTKMLRSEIVLGAPLPGFPHAGSPGQDAAVEGLIDDLMSVFDTFAVDGVRLVYGGDIITEAEILRTVKRDLYIAAASVAVILLYMVFHLQSVFLAVFAMWQLLLTFPVSLFIYAVVFRESYLGPLNILSIYIMVGIGVDDIFVFSNAFFYCQKPLRARCPSERASKNSWAVIRGDFGGGLSIEQRTAYALRKAGLPMLVTSTTSAVAFMANMISSIPAVRAFGLLMGILVIMNYVLVMSLYPAVLCMWMTYVHNKCCRKKDTVHEMTSTKQHWPCDYVFTGDFCSVHEAPLGSGKVAGELGDGQVVTCVSECDGWLELSDGGWVQQETECGTLAHHDAISIEDVVPTLTNPNPNPNPLTDQQEDRDTEVASTDDECLLIEGAKVPLLRRVFSMWVFPFLYKARYVLLVLSVVATAVFIYLASRLTHRDDTPSFYSSDHSIYIYRHRDELFMKSGDCVRESSACAPYWGRTGMEHHVGCNGVPFSVAELDVCGICGGNNSCVGCDGVAYSGKVRDACGVCGGTSTECRAGNATPTGAPTDVPTTGTAPPGSPCSPACSTSGGACTSTGCRMCNGITTTSVNLSHSVDACGKCVDAAAFNKSCAGCDGVPHSGLVVDKCGVCGGDDACKIVNTTATNTIVLFLLWGVDGDASWEDESGMHAVYDSKFDASHPACQSHLLSACKNRDYLGKLQASGFCIFQDFDRWLRHLPWQDYIEYHMPQNKSQGLPLPADSFKKAFLDYMISPAWDTRAKLGYTGWYGQLQYHPDLKYVRHVYRTRTPTHASPFEIHDAFEEWEQVMDTLNKNAPPMCKGYQSAHQWAKAFAQITAINGLAYAIAISLITSFVIILMFTCHVWITTMIVLTMGSIISATFSVFWMMGWRVGAVEAVSLSVVIGLSVDYCLHFAEAYTDVLGYVRREGLAFSRQEVLRKVVGEMGMPLVNAAATTILSTLPLLFCTIRPLVQFGQIMVISIGVSIVFTVFLFVPLLLVLGPRPFEKTLRVRVAAVLAPAVLLAVAVGIIYAAGARILGPDGETLIG